MTVYNTLISSESGNPRQSYDVISVIQDDGYRIAILLPVSFFVTSLTEEGRRLPADQVR